MKRSAAIAGSDLRRIFGGVSSENRSDVWHVSLGEGRIVASAVINECACEVTAPADTSGAFSFDVPAWLMGRVASRIEPGAISIQEGRSTIAIVSPSVEFRVFSLPTNSISPSSTAWPADREPMWRVDAGGLHRAARIAEGVAIRSSYFPVHAVQISVDRPGVMFVVSTDKNVRTDIELPTRGVAGSPPAFRAAIGIRHILYAVDILGADGEALDVIATEAALFLSSRLGRVRIPRLHLNIPGLSWSGGKVGMILSRLRLLNALEMVSALNENSMSVTLVASDGRLTVSGGSEKFGEVRAQVPLSDSVQLEAFRLWRRPLEDWLRTSEGDFVAASQASSGQSWQWRADGLATTSSLTMTTML